MARMIYRKEELRMLTCDEYILHQDAIPPLDKTWWLMDKGADNNFGFVVGKNKLYRGDYINTEHEIRAVLVTTSSPIRVGEQTTLHGLLWTKYNEVQEDKYTTRHFFITSSSIGTGVFDMESNIYDNSQIRKYCEEMIVVTDELDETEKEKEKRLKAEEKAAKKKAALAEKEAKAKEKKELSKKSKADKKEKNAKDTKTEEVTEE